MVSLAIPTYITALLHERYSTDATAVYYYDYRHIPEGKVINARDDIIGPFFNFGLVPLLAVNGSVNIRKPKYSESKFCI